MDPTSGDLAVSNESDSSNPNNSGDVAIYPKAQGNPSIYTDPNSPYMFFCGYDSGGNLYVDTWYGPFILSELPKGSSSFTDITVSGFPVTNGSAAIQWDGRYVAITDYSSAAKQVKVYRVQVSGTSGDIIGATTLKSRRTRIVGQTWIQGGTIVGITHDGKQGAYWPYPAGGETESQTRVVDADLWGAAVSLAPHQ